MTSAIPALAGPGPDPVPGAVPASAFVEHVHRAFDGPLTLPAIERVQALIWRALGEGQITWEEAGSLDGLARERRARIERRAGGSTGRSGPSIGQARAAAPRPRRDAAAREASRRRRRRVAASGAVPSEIAEHLTSGEIAVLSVVGPEALRARGGCQWAMERIAALAGVCRTVARSALRKAARLGLVTVRERRRRATRSDTNVITLRSKAWTRWLRRGRHADRTPSGQGGGCGNPRTTYTQCIERPSVAPIPVQSVGQAPVRLPEPSPQAMKGTGPRAKRRVTTR